MSVICFSVFSQQDSRPLTFANSVHRVNLRVLGYNISLEREIGKPEMVSVSDFCQLWIM